MDFFDWLSAPMAFLQVFRQYFQQTSETVTADEVAAAALRDSYLSVGIAGGIFLLCLILGGIGLLKLAQKENVKKSICAFLPFANIWYAGKIAGEASFFGQRMKRAGLYAMLCEIVYSSLEAFRLVLNFLLAKGEYYALDIGTNLWSIQRAFIPTNKQWMYDALLYTDYISSILRLFVFIFSCVLFIALFRKYYAKSPVLMMLLCTFFPFRGFVLFAVRNNEPVDYNSYMRSRAEEYARRYNTYNGGTQPPQSPQVQQGTQGSDPFTEFKDGTEKPSDDVFDDFK